jgi:hypothetical protein
MALCSESVYCEKKKKHVYNIQIGTVQRNYTWYV